MCITLPFICSKIIKFVSCEDNEKKNRLRKITVMIDTDFNISNVKRK